MLHFSHTQLFFKLSLNLTIIILPYAVQFLPAVECAGQCSWQCLLLIFFKFLMCRTKLIQGTFLATRTGQFGSFFSGCN